MRRVGWACLLLAAVVTPVRAAEPRPAGFFDEVAKHFDAWDANKDGRLSHPELYRLADNPLVRGEEAAAVAALIRVIREDRPRTWAPPAVVTRDYVGALAVRPARSPTEPPFAALYAAGLRHIRETKRVLFADPDPSLRAFRQGPLGDCFALAPVGALIARDPDAVRRLIRANPNGSYTVAFPGRPVAVPPVTDTEIALGSGTAGGGLWVNVYEKAVALDANARRPPDKRAASVLETISHGGSTAAALHLLTGHTVRTVRLRPTNAPNAPPAGAARATLDADLHKRLTDARAGRRLVCAASAVNAAVPGMSPHHAYAVVRFDPAAGVVHLWNPHGNGFTPKGEPGLKHGYPKKDGFSQMPLDDFLEVFQMVCIEEAGS